MASANRPVRELAIRELSSNHRDGQELINLCIAVFLRLLQSLAYRYSDKRRLLYFGRVI